jgi:hypothetical protein
MEKQGQGGRKDITGAFARAGMNGPPPVPGAQITGVGGACWNVLCLFCASAFRA